jgi:hypothetical protein
MGLKDMSLEYVVSLYSTKKLTQTLMKIYSTRRVRATSRESQRQLPWG